MIFFFWFFCCTSVTLTFNFKCSKLIFDNFHLLEVVDNLWIEHVIEMFW